MKKIEFDTVNGTSEVKEFGADIWYYGYVHNYAEICAILNHHQDNIIGGMIVNKENFDKIEEEYGIK